jgi:transcriptional regulator with XRE-family HTH domain
MASRAKSKTQHSGLYHAREARHMSRGELVKRSGVSKQQLSRLENGQIRLRLDHLKPFVAPLGYTAEQILLWDRLTDVVPPDVECAAGASQSPSFNKSVGNHRIREVDPHARTKGEGRAFRFKSDVWVFPEEFVKQELHASPGHLLVLEMEGDSMTPTILSGERVVVDAKHKDPSPDGLYAIRDSFGRAVIRRIQIMRATSPTCVSIIADNANHAKEEISLSKLEIEGKVVCWLKRG